MNSCKIVMYHYVRPIKKSRYPEIKGLEIDKFIRQLNFFKNNFNFIDVEKLIKCIYHNNVLPENSILLTFDDGFKDHFLHVFPILKKLGIKGLFFPPGKAIDEHVVLDVHKIHFILASSLPKQRIIDEIFSKINEYRDEYELKTPESYLSDLTENNRFDSKEVVFIKRILQRDLPLPVRSEITNYLFEKFITKDEKLFSSELYLSFEEINEMKESGMSFGSHAYTHEWLSNLPKGILKEEIRKSIEFNYKINRNNDNLMMCYPYGDFNNAIIDELKTSGFIAGFTSEVGDAIINKSNAFALSRYDTNDFPQ